MTSYNNGKKKTFVQGVYLSKVGTGKVFKVDNDINLEKIDVNKFPNSVLSDIGKGSISRECDFTYKPKEDEITISIFAFTDGKEKQINKTELPPPIDSEIYYGNIFVFAHVDNKLINLTLDTYNEFYEHSLGGIEDIGSQDSWSEDDEDENSEDREFIASEGSVSEEIEDSDDDEFLDSDHSDDENSEDDNDFKDKLDSIMNLKESDIMDIYLKDISDTLLQAPIKIKEMIYKHHNKNNEFLIQWFDYYIKKSRGKQGKIYADYKSIMNNYISNK